MNYSELTATIAGLSIGLIILVLLLVIPFLIFILIGNWKTFEKNGEEGWKALIPFYNSYIFTKIAGLNWWYAAILIFGTLLNSSDNSGTSLLGEISTRFIEFLIFYNLAKKAKKEPIGIGIVGAIFTPIMQIIMGFSKDYQFDNTVEVNPNGIFNSSKTNTNNTEPEKYCLGCGQKLKPNSKFCENCGKKVA